MTKTLLDYLDATKASPQLRELILCVADACRDIGAQVNNSAVTGMQGSLAQENVQGEVQKKLDVIANDMMLEAGRWRGHVKALVSEEMEDIYPIDGPSGGKDFLLIFDPIDGSSNLDVNGVVGTIFSVLKAPSGPVTIPDVLQSGRHQLAAGYAIYGPQTSLILSVGEGTAYFSLDAKGNWQLIEARMTISEATKEFAINMSNQRHWNGAVQRYIAECLDGKTGARGKDFNMRWLASMVGDVHRVLSRGGIFMYPSDALRANGKLRLLYEANPMSMLIEQAGGAATDGVGAILDIQPTELHQRVGVVLGSREEVERVQAYHKEDQQGASK